MSKPTLDNQTKRFYARQLKQFDNGSLWEAITKYDSHKISLKALVAFDNIITGMSNYNVYDLLQLWDEFHNEAKESE